VLTDSGSLDLAIPRDREGSFEPQLIAKGERRFQGFDAKIIAMYARGMTVREIQGYLEEMYGIEVSPDFISQVTEAVMAEVLEWQSRPLERLYPVVFFDCLRVKIRDEGVVRNKAIYLALGVLPDGTRDVLGLWIEQTEGAKFWMKVVNDLKGRGVEDILIAVVDGLKGFPEAIGAVFPQTTVQTCIVHLIRNSLEFASWKDRKAVAAAFKAIYQAPPERGGGPGGAGGLCRGPLGHEVRADSGAVAPRLGARDPVFCLSPGGQISLMNCPTRRGRYRPRIACGSRRNCSPPFRKSTPKPKPPGRRKSSAESLRSIAAKPS